MQNQENNGINIDGFEFDGCLKTDFEDSRSIELKKSQALNYYECLFNEVTINSWYKRLDFFFNKAQKKIDALLDEQKSEYFKDIRYQKRGSIKAIQYINLMKDIVHIKESMSLFEEQRYWSHRLANDYKNEFFKYEELFNLLKSKEYEYLKFHNGFRIFWGVKEDDNWYDMENQIKQS